MKPRWLLLLALWLACCCPVAAEAQNFWSLRPERLVYAVEALWFREAGRATISLTANGGAEFVGVIEGETSGVISWFTAHRRDRYRTVMRLVNGQLLPLVYTEESWRRGRHYYKEYRFNYPAHQLELWQRRENGELTLTWHTALTETFYDPISAFYNFRLGALGALKGGETITVAGIPYPEPEEIVIRIGLPTPAGQKVTVAIRNRAFDNESGLVHLELDSELVPREAWTRVLKFGKLRGRLIQRDTS